MAAYERSADELARSKELHGKRTSTHDQSSKGEWPGGGSNLSSKATVANILSCIVYYSPNREGKVCQDGVHHVNKCH